MFLWHVGCRRTPVSTVRGRMALKTPNRAMRRGFCFGLTLRGTPVGGRPFSSARRRWRPVSPFRPRPPSVASFLYPLQIPVVGIALALRRADNPRRPVRAGMGRTPVETEYSGSAGYGLARPRSLTVSPRASVEGARRVLQRRKSCAAEALSRRGAR